MLSFATPVDASSYLHSSASTPAVVRVTSPHHQGDDGASTAGEDSDVMTSSSLHSSTDSRPPGEAAGGCGGGDDVIVVDKLISDPAGGSVLTAPLVAKLQGRQVRKRARLRLLRHGW